MYVKGVLFRGEIPEGGYLSPLKVFGSVSQFVCGVNASLTVNVVDDIEDVT